MASIPVELPSGEQLQREIDAIEAEDHDAVVKATIEKRVKIADAKSAPLQSHDEVFATSKARLMARLSGKTDA